MAKFTSFLIIANGRVLQAFDDIDSAEASIEKYAADVDMDVSIAEVVSVYKRKVTYDKVSVD